MKFVIPIDAVPQQRPRVVKGKAYDPPVCAKFKEDFALLVNSQRTDTNLLTCPLKVDIAISRKFNSPTNKKFGDIDNLAKGILDACNSVIWKDDKQIVDLHVTKFIADYVPYIILRVEPDKGL